MSGGIELSDQARNGLQQEMFDALLGFADDGQVTQQEWKQALDWAKNLRSEMVNAVAEGVDGDQALAGTIHSRSLMEY